MNLARRMTQLLLALCLVAVAASAALAQTPNVVYEPFVGQDGKDVIWVPTPVVLVEKMLDMAQVTREDYVIDLGSGDGRNVIAAARRGAQALGVEYNQALVDYSTRAAEKEGVADKAIFVQGDMYEADISRATVIVLFLLTDNLRQLSPKLLGLKPGTRIVANTFGIEGWTAEESQKIEGDCEFWCVILLYIVPARVAGTWRLPQGELTLEQSFQTLCGTLSTGGASTPIENGRLRGDQIVFTAGGADYAGRVSGDTIEGEVKGGATGAWTATRLLAAP
jgi:precorrin-6B methylase 2